jgi:DNA-binding transcriptional LysR family regulator
MGREGVRPGGDMHSIRQFEIIQALTVHRHFGRAARALGISQPSLTRSLKELEARLGVVLFDRNGVEPTVFGRMALRYGEPILANAAELKREIDLAKGLRSGKLVVAAAMFPTDISARKAIGLIAARHPSLSVELIQSDWVRATEMVLKGEADVGVAELTAAQANDDLEAEPVRDSLLRFFCAANHPLAQRATVTVDDLMDYPWVAPALPDRMGAFLHDGKAFGFSEHAKGRFSPRIQVATFADMKEIVIAGQGLSAALPSQIEHELAEGLCMLLPVTLPWLTLNYGFITKRGRTLSPPATVFMDLVREIERELPVSQGAKALPKRTNARPLAGKRMGR